MQMIDVNAGFGFWPIQHFTSRSLDELDQVYARAGVEEVWLSAIESILYPEPDSFDLALFTQLKSYPRFRAVKTVNPLLANWKASCEQAMQATSLHAIKLFPNYHGYPLEHESVDALCQFAASHRLPVLIQTRVNDERNQPHFLQVPSVKAEEIARLSIRHPNTVLIALCCFNPELGELDKGSENLFADIAFLDQARLLEECRREFPSERLVFGSHEAFAHVQSSLLKLKFSQLPQPLLHGIAADNLLKATHRGNH